MSTTHSGTPRVQFTATHVLILCPMGHLVQSIRSGEWAHSGLEARIADPSWTVACGGSIVTYPPRQVLPEAQYGIPR